MPKRDNEDLVRVPLTGGLDTKTAPAETGSDSFQILENGEFVKHRVLKKRPGYTQIDPFTVYGGPIVGTPRGLASYRNDVVLVTESNTYSRQPQTENWIDVGRINCISRTSKDITHSTSNQHEGSMARANGVTAYVWSEAYPSNGSIKYAVVDEAHGTMYASNSSLGDGNSHTPRVVACGNNLLFTYVDGGTGTLRGALLNTVSPQDAYPTLPTFEIISGTLHSTNLYTVTSSDSFGFIAWRDTDVGNVIQVGRLNSSGQITQVVTVSNDLPDALGIAYSATSQEVGVAWLSSSTTGKRAQVSAIDLSITAAASTVSSGLSGAVRATMIPKGSDGTFIAAYEQGSFGSSQSVYFEGSRTVLQAWIASTGFEFGVDGAIILGHESRTGLQNSYYLYTHDARCSGSLANGIAVDNTGIHHPFPVSDNSVVLPIRRSLDVDNYQAQFAHVALRQFDFQQTKRTYWAELGDTLYIAGSQLWIYDNCFPVEAGFHMFPDVKVGTLTATAGSFNDFATVNVAGGLLDLVQYNYRIYYEWETRRGERMRSLALTRSYVPDFSGANGKIQITIPCISHTLKDPTYEREAIAIVVYRSEGNSSSLYYRVSSPDPQATGDNGYVANDINASTVTFTDALADSAITAFEFDNESLFQLKHVAPYAPRYLAVKGQRLWMAGGEVPRGSVVASKLAIPGETAQFAAELEIPVSDDDVTCLGPVDDAMIVFTRNRMYGVLGDPDNLGAGQQFFSQNITTDVGAHDDCPVAIVPQGIMFESNKGIYAYGPGQAPVYVGWPVEAYNSQNYIDAAVIPDTNQVIFLAETGYTLMYDYQFDKWSTFTNHSGKAITTTRNGDLLYLRNDNNVYVRNTSLYTDAGAPYALKFRTGNLPDETAQRHLRVRRVGVLGEWKSPHKLRVSVYHGRDPHPTESFIWDPAVALITEYWGVGDYTWPGPPPDLWGGFFGSTDYQFLIRLRRQKSGQIRIQFEDILTESAGASYELNEILLSVEDMSGVSRLGKNKKV